LLAGVDVVAADTPALPVDEQADDVVETQAVTGEQEEQTDGQRRSRRTPRSQRIEGQRRKRINEDARGQRDDEPQADVQLTAAAQADAAQVKVEEPAVPVITIPSAEAVAAALQASAALTEHVVPPTINHRVADEECDVDCVPNTARRMEVTHALVTASSYAGHCSALLLSAFPET
jgi:ribonuclease E